MTALTWVLLAFAVIGLLFGLWQWTARRRTVQRLDNMLEQSIFRRAHPSQIYLYTLRF